MTRTALISSAEEFGTPVYTYDVDAILERLHGLRDLFAGQFDISYAIKANPNMALLRAMRPHLDTFDASSFAEVQRALDAGMAADRISFSGPAKRPEELERSVAVGVGEMVIESLSEAKQLSEIAERAGRVQPCLVRINPLKVPKKFGASMAGAASQFGIDEELIGETLPVIAALPGLRLEGFHIYSGTNCLDADAIAENFSICCSIFNQAVDVTGCRHKRVIFGSGFGIPYLPDETPLDHAQLPGLVLPIVKELLSRPEFAEAKPTLELGRWLVGPFGWLLMRVISCKSSRGKEIRTCDAGFNNHLAACGMMGSVFRRNWVYENLTNPDGDIGPYTLVGPLCTTIDRLAADLEIAEPRVGDILAIPQSGAYGLTSSPTRFISHPEPREVVLQNGQMHDASESLLNHRVEGQR